ncbi:MAG: DNA primase [Wenzhouxiangellaceae bacterium]|nr:DNA primase [Wenzhouxiangellaceae bacterium]
MIPESFIEQLLERVDIVDVVGSRVPLKSAGHEFKACCPFHDEKTPSFYVSPQKQFYHCFGCGAHGTAVGFVMAYDGLEFPAAIEELASMAGLEVPRDEARPADDAQKREREALHAALEAAQAFFRSRLREAPAAGDYLDGRGLDAATIEEFGIGYAPDQWSALVDRLQQRGFDEAALERAGLASRTRNGKLIDRFRNRIMFPIRDRRGRAIAFGGRALGEDGPKYLNSAESPVFHKGRELYRLFEVRRGGLPEQLLVVEGYMDAAALWQFGFHDAVATLGTAVTADHLELMFRATSLAVFCFDGDAAGRRAAWKGLETALPLMRANRELRFLFLPEGDDPDSLVRREGADGLRARLDRAVPLSQFLFDELGRSLDLATPDGRARLVALAEPLLARLPEGPFSELMRGELARRSGLGLSQRTTARRPAARPRPERDLDERPLSPVQYSVALLVQHPELARTIDQQALGVSGELKGVAFLSRLIEFCRQKPNISTALVLEHWRDAPEGPFLARLAARDLAVGTNAVGPALNEALQRIHAQQVRGRIRQLQQIQAAGGLTKEQADELRHWLKQRVPGAGAS